MQGVILAAGHGSRLQPITLTRSKAMVPILGKPIVERVMEQLLRNGVDDLILVVSPRDRYITRYFRRESRIEAALCLPGRAAGDGQRAPSCSTPHQR
jgi:NDP-sugar pyrophosphorylase family protein